MWKDEVKSDPVCEDSLAVEYVRNALGVELESMMPGDRKFSAEWIDLNGDGSEELFAVLVSPYFCGTGGCTWLVINYDGTVLTRGSVAGYPVYVGEVGSESYRTLYVRSGGSYHVMEFSNGSYPSNPSVEPAIQLFSDPAYTRAGTTRLVETAGFHSCSF
jgi:hypothetical protein